ncbi:hypothetical protein LSAT2_005935 [Lamellibrachia satsuma]|nr:hypothetical protein LSAT2_005935 [Lamellibrachia satsuma]
MGPSEYVRWFLLLGFLPAATGFRFGDPTNVCVSMIPRHVHTGNVTHWDCPYKLELLDDATTYTPGQTLKVCVTGSPFQGILLQARAVGGIRPVGTFDDNIPSNTKLIKCTSDSDSVTHSNTVVKADPTCFIWKAPDEEQGDLKFVATIVQDHNIFFVHVTSDVISAHNVWASGWEFGTPTDVCISMTPLRVYHAEDTRCSYKLELDNDATTYIPGQTLKVCVTGSPFQGILLQARAVGGMRPVGTFDDNIPPNTKLMKCASDSDSVTHSNTAVKADPTCFIWKAPDEDQGDLKFVATIVQDHNIFFVHVTSDVISAHSVWASGWKFGAPTDACINMTPQYVHPTENTRCSYKLELENDATTYIPGQTLKVCVTGSPFQGILLQARAVGGMRPIGTFDDNISPNTKLMKCASDSDSVTHSNTAVKADPTCFIWKAPDEDQGDLKFVATIVQDHNIFFVHVTSDVISAHSVWASGWKFGAPTDACINMTPQYVHPTENTRCSYKLELENDATTYIPGQTLKVCVTGSPFQGILLQARAVGGMRPIGTFDDNISPNTKLMKCASDSDSVTHSNTAVKADPTCFIWKAPDEDQGDLTFVATIVQDHNIFFVHVTSDVISAHSVWASGWKFGAPTQACINMTPQHVYPTEDTPCSYKLELEDDVTTYIPGQTLKVCVTGNPFQGILLQARAVGVVRLIGTFDEDLPSSTKLMKCASDSDSVTHSDNAVKADPTCFIWKAPNEDQGDLKFVATIIEDHNVFFVDVTSDIISAYNVLDLSSEHWAGDLRRRWRQFVETSSNFLLPRVLPFLGSAGCWLMRNTGVIPEFLRSFVDEFVDCDGIVNSITNYFSPVKQITA